MKDMIERVLNEEVRPMLETHGGNVELVEVSADGVVKVRLTGGCSHCMGAQMTLTNLVEGAIKSRVPQVKRVEAV